MQQPILIKIYAEWEQERKLWVSSCSDLCGLETEAGTLTALEEKLETLVPDLFRQNGIEGRAALIVNSL